MKKMEKYSSVRPTPEWWNGIHARLKIASRKGWRFESSLRHKKTALRQFFIARREDSKDGMSEGE